VIRERKDRDGLQVQVYAGRDPLTGRKRYVSRQVPGSGRVAMKQAKQVEARLLAEVAAGKQQASGAMTLGQLLEEWIAWRESNGKPISPATLHNYRLTSTPGSTGGYDHAKYRRVLRAGGIRPLITRRRVAHGSGLGRWRWPVERTLAWLHQYRRLRVRWERQADIHEGLLQLACCLISWRCLQRSFG
jgi:transposase